MRKAIVGLVVALLVLLLAGAWWLGRAQALQFALERAVVATEGRLSVGQVDGSLFGEVRVDRVGWREPAAEGSRTAGQDGLSVELRGLRFAWQPWSLLAGELDVVRLAADEIEVVTAAGNGGPAPALPDKLGLPLRLQLRELAVGRLAVAQEGQPPTVLRQIALRARYRPGLLRIEHLRVASEYGHLALNGELGDAAPYRLLFAIQGQSAWQSIPVAALLTGDLRRMGVSVAAAAPAAPVEAIETALVSARFDLAPFDLQPLGPIDLRIRRFDPASLGLGGGVSMQIDGAGRLRVTLPEAGAPLVLDGEFELANQAAGPVGKRLLPVESAKTGFRFREGLLQLEGLEVSLAGGGRVAGRVELDTVRQIRVPGIAVPAPVADLSMNGLDLHAFVDAIGRTRLDGHLRAADKRVELQLADAGLGGARLDAAVRLDAGRLMLESAALSGLPGLERTALSANGSLELDAPNRLQIQGELTRLNPAGVARFVDRIAGIAPAALSSSGAGAKPAGLQASLDRLAGSVDASWSLTAALGKSDRPGFLIGLKRLAGEVGGVRVEARGGATLEAARLNGLELALSVGNTRLQASGALGLPQDRLELSLRSPDLRTLAALAGVPQLAGRLSATGALSGSLARPAVELVASADALMLPGGAVVGSVRLDARVPELRAQQRDSQLSVRMQAADLRLQARRLEALSLDLAGTLSGHRFRVGVDGVGMRVRVAGQGGYDENWRARIDELSTEGKLRSRLTAPLSLTVGMAGGAAGAELTSGTIETESARLELARAAWRDGRFALDARLQVDRIGPLLALGQQVGADPKQVGADPAESLDLPELAELGLRVALAVEGSSIADLNGSLDATVVAAPELAAGGTVRLGFTQGTLSGDVDLRLPSLAFTERMVGPEWRFDGSIGFTGSVSGTLTRPRLAGDIRGERLLLEQRALGWRLGDGSFVGRFDGESLRVESLRMASLAKGGGEVRMRGQVQVETMQGRFDFIADRLVVPIGPGQRVVLSGDASAASKLGRFEIAGKLRADEGRIELVGGDAPKLPPDVIVKEPAGQQTPSAPAEAEQPLMIETNLKLDLGDKLFVHGSGLDARLSGELTLKGTLPDSPRGYGTVRVRDGVFAAYGKELEIERGRVIFNGALDNPVLDIVALRKGPAVEAGVAVSGTALAPRIRLTSRPDVPDAEKLSWLVLGQPLDSAEGAAQFAALQAAAATMFGSNDGSMSGGLQQTLGLDVLTVRSASSGGRMAPQGFGDRASFPGQLGRAPNTQTSNAAAENVIAVGKRLSSKLMLSYEQGLHGTWSLLRVQYDLTRRLSVRAQTGTQTALDFLLRYPFD